MPKKSKKLWAPIPGAPDQADKFGMLRAYSERFINMAQVACANGMMVNDLAELFGVNPKTIHEWQRVYPDFKAAVLKGREDWDNATAVNSLKKKILGYEYEETVTEYDAEGNEIGKRVLKKHQTADTAALKFWLINRHKDKWRNYTSTEFSGPDGKPIEIDMSVARKQLLSEIEENGRASIADNSNDE